MTKTEPELTISDTNSSNSSRGSHSALLAVSEGVVVANKKGQVEFLNPAAELLSGWNILEAANRSVDSIFELHEEDSGQLMRPACNWETPQSNMLSIGRCTLRNKDGSARLIDANVSPVVDNDGTITGSVLILRDLSAETGLRKQLNHHAQHDALTGLFNRAAFESALSALSREREVTPSANVVVYIDIDQFRIVNNNCGHAAGDHFLLLLADKLKTRVRESDVLARLGGDEFGVLLKGCNLAHAKSFAEEVCHMIENLSFVWNGKAYRHTASIGVAEISAESTVEATMSAADVACFTAKDSGRNRVHLYHDESVPSRHVEMQWVARISRALDEDRLTIFQQPIVPIGRDVENSWPHYELLVRLTDRFGRIILPKYFIAAAERYNLMPRVDRWVVNQVLTKLIWRKELQPEISPYTLSVNLSGASLSDESFMKFLEETLERQPIAPGALCFEVTETATIANIARVAEFMRRLKRHGCSFSLDDFGSGLSSFAYLKELPVDMIKIDGDFVADIINSPADAAVVDAINRVGKAMDIRTVAECVESAELLEALRETGIDYAQGFHFAKPRAVRSRASFVAIQPDPHTVSA